MDSSNTVMASFDIKSLFTNIPLDETIDICTDTLNEKGLLPSRFSTNDFKKLLSVAVKDVIFLFNSKIYKQIDGVAMGSPLGPTLANAFLCHYETKWLDNCPPDFKPVFIEDMSMIHFYCSGLLIIYLPS